MNSRIIYLDLTSFVYTKHIYLNIASLHMEDFMYLVLVLTDSMQANVFGMPKPGNAGMHHKFLKFLRFPG